MSASFISLRSVLRLVAVLAAGWFSASIAFAQVTATSSFDPVQLAAGQIGTYRLALSDDPAQEPPQLPYVQGLETKYRSRSEQANFSFSNGTMTKQGSLTWIYLVRAAHSGTYTVPAFRFQVNGKSVTVPEATLTVTDAPAAPPPGSVSQPISLTANVPRLQVYVGEKFPLDLVLAVRDDLRLAALGAFSQVGDAFEQVHFSDQQKADESQIQQNDHTFATYTWHNTDTVLKTGNQTLRFSMPVAVIRMGDVNASDDMMAQFLSRAGMGFGQQQQATIDSTPLNFTVLPLPAEGRPSTFSGGIGVFSVDSPTLSTNDLQVGAPITLTMNISGKGNFDRLEAPPLDPGPLWRAYKPKATFTPSDATGYQGTKTFEYVLMPLSEKITEVPPPQFNYFNPETKQYVDLTPPPIPVTVKPPAPGQSPPALPVVTTNNAAASAPTLVGLRTEPGDWVSPNLAPLLFSPYFLAGQAIPAALLGALIFVRRRQLHLQSDPAYARRVRARKSALAAVNQARAAATAGHAAEFYAIAQRALQEAASASTEWKHGNAAEALTWEEFNTHLTARSAPAETRDAAREIFEAGDALRFGGFTPDPEVLAQAVPRLDALVQQLLRLA